MCESQRAVRGSPWESATELHGICSRRNRRTGQMGALMYCKTKHLFGFEGEERDAALFVGSLPLSFFVLFRFSVVFPGPSSLSYQGLEVRSPICPTVLANELTANRTSVFLSSIYFCLAPRQFIIMAWLHKPFTTTVSVWCQRYISSSSTLFTGH